MEEEDREFKIFYKFWSEKYKESELVFIEKKKDFFEFFRIYLD